MSCTKTINEYLDNIQALLKKEPQFSIVIERQIQHRLVPQIAGVQAELEPALWRLLCFCLDGPTHELTELSEHNRQVAQKSIENLLNFQQNGPARYPNAAKSIWEIFLILAERGLYPAPKI